MANDVKINIYLKGREKPITFHDKTTDDDTFQEKVNYFFDMLTKKKKGVAVIDFSDDNLVIPMEQIEFAIVTKPRLDESQSILDIEEEKTEDLNMNDSSDEDTEDNVDITESDTKLEVIE